MNDATAYCSVPVFPGVYTRVSAVEDWVQGTICKLTDDASALPFGCPDFVCPPDIDLLGLANSKVPDASNLTESFNGFSPVTITQQPAAGSPLLFGWSTMVNVTATSAAGDTRSCVWKVTVPEVVLIGRAEVQLKRGTSRSRHALYMERLAPGVALQLGVLVHIGSLQSGPGKPDGVVQGRLRSDANTTTAPITLKGAAEGDTKVLDLKRPVRFTPRSNLRVLVKATNLPRTAVVLCSVYGQYA